MTRRTTRRRDTPPLWSVMWKGGATVAVLAAAFYIATTAFNGVPFKNYTTIYVDLVEAGNLRIHDNVSIGGVRIGQVITSTATPEGRARVELQLEPSTKLPRDTRVRVRANGLLGARYVQLVPGRSATLLREGDTIRGGADARTFGVTDALDTFDAQTRGALGKAVRNLGTGMLGNGEALNEGLRVSSDAAAPFQQLLRTVRADPGAVERLAPSINSAMLPLAANRRQLADLFGPAADALQPLVGRRDDVRATLAQAPSALTAATAGLIEGHGLLVAAEALAVSARRTLPAAPAGLRQARALLAEAQRPLRRARPLVTDLEPAVPAALKVTKALDPVLPPLRDGIADLVPILAEVGRYGCDLHNFGVVFRSMTGFGGTGTGPNGSASQFRLQVLGGAEVLGTSVRLKPQRDAYPEPCKYSPGGTYLTTIPKLTNAGGR